MNPLAAAGIGAAIALLAVAAVRAGLITAFRRFDYLVLEALSPDWHHGLDDEHRRLIEEGA